MTIAKENDESDEEGVTIAKENDESDEERVTIAKEKGKDTMKSDNGKIMRKGAKFISMNMTSLSSNSYQEIYQQ